MTDIDASIERTLLRERNREVDELKAENARLYSKINQLLRELGRAPDPELAAIAGKPIDLTSPEALAAMTGKPQKFRSKP